MMNFISEIKTAVADTLANGKAYVLANAKPWGVGVGATLATQWSIAHFSYIMGVLKAVF